MLPLDDHGDRLLPRTGFLPPEVAPSGGRIEEEEEEEGRLRWSLGSPAEEVKVEGAEDGAGVH